MKRRVCSLLTAFVLVCAGSAAAETEGLADFPAAGELPVLTLPEHPVKKCVQGAPEKDDRQAAFLSKSFLPGSCDEEGYALYSLAPEAEAGRISYLACSSEAVETGPELDLFARSIDATGCESATVAAVSDLDSDIPVVVNKNVESFVKYFQTNGRKYFDKWLDRSRNYMTMLRGILKENGMPEDLSYIAFIESGLNPTVKSRANAVGMWQFIKGTAQRYGLRVDWWIDERMDPEKATVAASKYFKKLYGQFGSWYLAAAGYNAGEGKVAKAIRKHDTDDFWELASQKKPFKRETKEYVPKFLAAIMIGKDPGAYGFDERPESSMSYDRVKVATATDLRVIAEATGTSVSEIKRLNPELLRWFTPPNYPDYELKIPAGTKKRYLDHMSKLPPTKKIAFIPHKVKRGENAKKIAKRYGTTADRIMVLNNIATAKLKPGTIIMVPVQPANAKKVKGDAAYVYTYQAYLQS